MIMSDEWESPNSKVVDYGAYALAGILIWLGLVFYPAVVVGIQVGNAYDTFDEGVMPGTIAAVITLVAIVLLWAGAKAGSPICWFLVIGLYVICLVPFCQWLHHVYTADYVSSAPDNFDKEPFPGFDWFWFVPSSDNPTWNWGVIWEEIILDWLKTVFLISAILLPLAGVMMLFSGKKEK
jgi:hypothetical protein